MAALTTVRMNPISSNMSTTAKSAGCDSPEEDERHEEVLGVCEPGVCVPVQQCGKVRCL